MKVKYDPESDILLFLLKETPPCNAISEPGGIIFSYDDSNKTISIEFLNASQRRLIDPQNLNLTITI